MTKWLVMELLILLPLLLLFLLPSFFLARKQRKRQQEIFSFQDSLTPGREVITAGGIHGTVVGVRDGEVDLEVSSGTTLTFDKISIVRPVEQGQASVAADASGEVPGEERTSAEDAAVEFPDNGRAEDPETFGDNRS